MTDVVVSEYLPEPHLERLRRSHRVVYDPDLYGDRSRLLAEITDAAAILIRNRTQIDTELLDAAPRLRVVGRLGVGLDNIDLAACSERDVRVIPATGANSVSVAEYVIGTMLVLVRGVFGMTASMVAGEWPRQGHAFGHELMGKVLGLIGCGAIAREVATRARAFGMTVVAADPLLGEEDPVWKTIARVGLDDLLTMSDVVSIHVPLSASTRGLIDGTALGSMKTTAVLINTSRGGVVDEAALADALRSRSIAGAALDVFEHEPLGAEPASRFNGLENLILTPHVAGNTEESVERVADLIVGAVLEALDA